MQRSIRQLAECRAGILWGTGINLQADKVFVDEPSHRHERAGGTVGIRADVPSEFVEPREAGCEVGKVEFKADEARLTVIATADDFCRSQVKSSFPTLLGQFALITDSGDAGERFKQCRGLMDQGHQPFGSTSTFLAVPLVIFQLLEQVMNQQVRVGQSGTPVVRANTPRWHERALILMDAMASCVRYG